MVMYLSRLTTKFPALYRRRMRAFLPTWFTASSMDRISAVLPFHNFRWSPAFKFLAALRVGLLMSFPSLLLRYFHHLSHH